MAYEQLSTLTVAFDILERLSNEDRATPTEIAETVDMPLSTVHGYLSTLESIGYLKNQNGEYQVSAKALEIGIKARENDPLYNESWPVIDKLAVDLGEHVSISIKEDADPVLYYAKDENHDIKLKTYPGLTLPRHATAAGKTTLAFLPPERRTAVLDDMDFEQRTRNTITDRSEFEDELRKVRDREVAHVREEYKLGLSSVGAPVFSDDTLLGTVCLATPERRMSRESFKEEATRKVETASNTIEVNLRNQ